MDTLGHQEQQETPNQNNMNHGDPLSSPIEDDQRTKIIHTIPPPELYPREFYEFIPIRLLPMSKLADIGEYIDWIQVQQQVSHLFQKSVHFCIIT
jgi:hypothetical protein